MTADVDVVVLTWNDGPLLERAVASALASSDVEVAVVVVDNGSEPPASVVDDERVRIVRSERNLGVARGRNLGVRAGDAPLVLLLDSDAELRPDALAELRRAIDAELSVGLAAPVFVGQPATASAGRAPTLRRKAARVLGRVETYEVADAPVGAWWPVEVAIGACQLFRRSAYERVGGIDEAYFYGPEDVDFCMRLLAAGFGVVQVGGALVVHPPRRRHRRLLTRRGIAHAWAVTRFLWRHRGRRRPILPRRPGATINPA